MKIGKLSIGGHREAVIADERNLREGTAIMPFRLWQIIAWNRWTLAVVKHERIRHSRQNRLETRAFLNRDRDA